MDLYIIYQMYFSDILKAYWSSYSVDTFDTKIM